MTRFRLAKIGILGQSRRTGSAVKLNGGKGHRTTAPALRLAVPLVAMGAAIYYFAVLGCARTARSAWTLADGLYRLAGALRRALHRRSETITFDEPGDFVEEDAAAAVAETA